MPDMPDDIYYRPANIVELQKAFSAARLPISNVRLNSDLTLAYDWHANPTMDEFQAAAEIVAAVDSAETAEAKLDKEYAVAGATAEMMVEALWQMVMENNKDLADAIQASREVAKSKNEVKSNER